MKNLTKTLILTTVILLTLVTPIFAVTQSEIDTTLTSLEDQRISKLEEELGLTIPDISDNPNHIITFRDPSGEVGVKLEIDGQGFKKVVSPYTLPSLGIGKHVLTFKFTDSEEAPQTLEETITIIPRPPIIDAPEKLELSQLTFKGTALAASTLDLYLTSGTKSYRGAPEVSSDGSWTYTFKAEFSYGIYNVVAITRKNGFASNFSETIVFELSKSGDTVVAKDNVTPISFSFSDLIKQSPVEVIKSNPDLAILTASALLLGIITSLFFTKLGDNRAHKNLEGMLVNKFNGKDKKEDSKEEKTVETKKMTLREKFENAGIKKEAIVEEKKEEVKESEVEEVKKDEKVTKESEKKEEVVEEKPVEKVEEVKEEKKEEKKDKVLTKAEFLQEFKDQDPDTEKGEEKVEKEVKEEKKEEPKTSKTSNLMNSIKISLTSKPKK
ncbi:hypothetical protein HYV12_00040 [Candidatus Dojkabacteria bacterium]|nr:hypothetical protein [Candidatus Dojkabacteria bacterium]